MKENTIKNILPLFWAGIISLFFLFLCIYAVNMIQTTLNDPAFGIQTPLKDTINLFLLENISFTLIASFVIYILAVFRFVRLVVYDSITLPLRKGITSLAQEGNSFWVILKQLTGCPWCFSVWATLLTLFLPLFFGFFGFFILAILAVSGITSIIILIANAIGWYAEHKKGKVK